MAKPTAGGKRKVFYYSLKILLVLLIFKNFLVEIRFPFILYLLQNLVSLYLSLTKICESSETTNYISIKHNWRIFNKTSLADLYTIIKLLK